VRHSQSLNNLPIACTAPRVILFTAAFKTFYPVRVSVAKGIPMADEEKTLPSRGGRAGFPTYSPAIIFSMGSTDVSVSALAPFVRFGIHPPTTPIRRRLVQRYLIKNQPCSPNLLQSVLLNDMHREICCSRDIDSYRCG